MSIHCSNCGHQNDDGSKFCEACGCSLTQSQAYANQSFESTQDSSSDFNWMFAQEKSFDNSINVKTKLDPQKLNKANKEVFGVAIAFLIISIVRVIFSFFSVGTLQTFVVSLPLYQQRYPEIAILMHHIINTMSVEYFIFAAALATSISLMIFAAKMKRHKFPVQSTEIFDLSQKAFRASTTAFVLMVVFLIIEIVGVVNIVELDKYFEDEMFNLTSTITGFIVDFCWILCTGGCAFYALRIAKSRE